MPLKTPKIFQVHMRQSLQFISQPHFINVSFTQHINIASISSKYILCYFHYDCSLLCYEFPESTPLDKYLKNRKIVLNLDTILVVAVDLIDAIQCLENRGIVHNNITTSTVLIAKGFRVSNKCLDIFFLRMFFFFSFFFSLRKSSFCNV